MLFAKKALGIEISQEGVKMALVGGKRDLLSLDAYGAAPFPADTVKFSLREANIHNPAAFVAGIRETYLKLLTSTVRASVSLPDSIGRVMLMDLETRFKSKAEGADIIRWKLKKSFPFDINEAHLDYQVLRENDSGEISALVSLISRQVLNQYEDLFAEAGLQPNRIDFTTFNLFNLFSKRLELAENAAVMICYGEVISIMIFYGGTLEFYRTKDIPGGMIEANRVFREISNSLLVYGDRHPGHSMQEVFCIAYNEDAEAFSAVVTEATGLEPVLLDVERIVARKNGFAADRKTLHTLTAALGAAIRNL
ncbi:MAG: type IV pilus assembly protein [Geobacteraceae bacterium]|nr:MAG: type IV pilus assembly protein [Geobacteraceae bacterium]